MPSGVYPDIALGKGDHVKATIEHGAGMPAHALR
jgi:hypothetical protein